MRATMGTGDREHWTGPRGRGTLRQRTSALRRAPPTMATTHLGLGQRARELRPAGRGARRTRGGGGTETRLSLLGPPRLRVDGSWVELPPTRWVALLAYLARCGGWVRREALAALFWPDHDDHGAALNLRQTLQTIVRSPGGAALEREPVRVRWAGGCDVEAFEELVRERAWDAAVEAYRGTFLDGVELDHVPTVQTWIETERTGLHERWRTCALTLAASRLETGACRDALILAEGLLQADPYDEAALRLLLQSTVACGDRQRALRSYRAACERMASELQLEPEDDTRLLAADLDLEPPER